MATTDQTRLISSGTTYYLNGHRTPYAGSGTGWTAQSTSPFMLSMNDKTGPTYTPAPAPTVPILGGGPPFRIGQSLIAKSYGNVTETFGLQIYATSHDNAVALVRMLKQILNTALYDAPCILAVQPPNATNTVYFEILYADVPELPDYLWEKPNGVFVFRVPITIVRTIGSAGAFTTLINAVSIRNRGTSAPDDVESLGTIAGDLINEGQPLNVILAPTAGGIGNTLYLATIASRVTTSLGTSVTTSGTGGSVFGGTPNATITALRNVPYKIRILARLTTFTNPSHIRLFCKPQSADGSASFRTSPTIALPSASASTALVDFGWFDITPLRSIQTSGLADLEVDIFLASDGGTSVTATLDYFEVLLYYTFAKISGAATTTTSLVIEQANDYNPNGIVVPSRPPRVYSIVNSSGNLEDLYSWRGTLPRAYSGASLYASWLDSTDTTHPTTDTANLTVKHLPIFQTLRGSG
jgi:hypothetical protein